MTDHKSNHGVKHFKVRGARHNNLKNFDLDIPLGEMTVVTGVSGSGKSSLVFDTIYSEGQRRYVQTFSPYARQFLQRMDRPNVDAIDSIPPAVAINQVNPVRTSRSTVGTITEIYDYLKVLFARAASLYCPCCGSLVKCHSPSQICDQIIVEFGAGGKSKNDMIQILFEVHIPENLSRAYVKKHLQRQGYQRMFKGKGNILYVVQDRVKASSENSSRLTEAIEVALKIGGNQIYAQRLNRKRKGYGKMQGYTTLLLCVECKLEFSEPFPNLFSFNSPIGACSACDGSGQELGIDYGLVIPDGSLSIAEGAIALFNEPVFYENYLDIMEFGEDCGFPLFTPWEDLSYMEKDWVIWGEREYFDSWYGVQSVFDLLETRQHRKYERGLISQYRAYVNCSACDGSRLRYDAHMWRLGNKAVSNSNSRNHWHPDFTMSDQEFEALPGHNMHDVVSMSLERCAMFFDALQLPSPFDEASKLLVNEIRTRLRYLVEVGVGYLSLDRQSNTLSGGEVQRINLTTALGVTLTNTLFVLDEPTVGLHQRDVGKMIGTLRRLRDAGNTLLVVEHDEQMIRAGDRILELGPGAGERGGNVIHYGSLQQLLDIDQSETAACLRSQIRTPSEGRTYSIENSQHDLLFPIREISDEKSLWIQNARQNNLQNIDVAIPLNKLVCITGVSGSGKSTLMDDILFRGIRRLKGESTKFPGKHDAILGVKEIDKVMMVSQSAIGKTARSNPASYLNVLRPIRQMLSLQQLSIHRNYNSAHFSFNLEEGQCPTCQGSGFEHIEMQFLSDVYLRCPDCNGTRFKQEICDVKLPPEDGSKFSKSLSIVEILELTVEDAIVFFGASSKVGIKLQPLASVGLEYMRLGQPIPTLSGGEAQRLKLAAHIAEGHRSQIKNHRTLFLLDEPTTGLHYSDISKLISALHQLLENGHSVVVIEHNLHLIANSDWIIDLGPDGGDRGGEVIAEGSPAELVRRYQTPTSQALKKFCQSPEEFHSREPDLNDRPAFVHQEIVLKNAREHNLKNIDLSIPYNAVTVITGLSGSGKSTVAFDILFAEGQRRYLETVNAYARQFVQPATQAEFDSITGLPPTVAIEQRLSQGGIKSTVATTTEIYHYLRLLFVRFGEQYCPKCKIQINPQSVASVVGQIERKYVDTSICLFAPLVVARKGLHRKIASAAFNQGAKFLLVDGNVVTSSNWVNLNRYQQHDIDMPVGTIDVSSPNSTFLYHAVETAGKLGNGHIRVATKDRINRKQGIKLESYSTSRSCPSCKRSFEKLDPRMFSYNSKLGWCEICAGSGIVDISDDDLDIQSTGNQIICPECNGKRLNPDALSVKFKEFSIDQITELSIRDTKKHFEELELTDREEFAIRDIQKEILARLEFLESVGLGYLSLDRSAPTLSGGEAQRIRLAANLGSGLCGACYVLDEPTIGLHSRDNRRLLSTLASLRDKGNTIVIVEHDEETITSADHIIDLGPEGGTRGGEVVACGTVSQIMDNSGSITGRMLREPIQHPMSRQRPVPTLERLVQVQGARLHNLKEINAIVPVRSLVCVTGVSGSGKSTLIRDILYENLAEAISGRRLEDYEPTWSHCDEISGQQHFRRVLEVNQKPIGKTPRSCPATYVKVWRKIRELYAETTEAKVRGYTASRFSFNIKEGQCQACKGQGELKIELNFLPDVRVKCESCNGERFNRETLEVRYRGKTISDVLKMSMEEALVFFDSIWKLKQVFELLVDVGLGYLKLGQPSPTLSGGEAQRIKLVSELAKAKSALKFQSAGTKRQRKMPKTLFLLDEPTVGLHTADVEKLMRVIHQLVDAGNTVVIIEHNLDVIAEADWVIDLGPEGGDQGGKILFQGLQEDFLKADNSFTATALRSHLRLD